MGLDLYLERISKPLFEENTIKVSTSNFKEECETVKKLAIIKEDIAPYYDFKKIAKDYGLDEKTIYICRLSSDGVSFNDGKESRSSITIPSETIEKKYILQKTEEFYFFESNEVAYQRKGLNDIGWELLEKIGNCVNCDDKEKVKELVEKGNLSKDFIDNWIDGETVFCAWW